MITTTNDINKLFNILRQPINYSYRSITGSPAGFSRVNGVHRTAVPKHETSTLRQSHNLISIDLKFGVGDNVKEVTSPAKFGSDPVSGRYVTWGQHILVR